MKTTFIKILILIFALGLFPLRFSGAENLTPNITSITPTKIQVGDEIEIFGENFGNEQLKISAGIYPLSQGSHTNQDILEWSNTKIRAKMSHVKLGTNHLCIHDYITGYTDDICFENITFDVCSTENCAEVNPPVITSVSPTTVRRGDILEVIGNNFDNALNKTQMEFAPFSIGQVISWSNTKILVKVSSGAYIGINTVSTTFNDNMGSGSSIRSPEFIVKDVCKSGDDWSCSEYTACSESGIKTRICVKSGECESLNSLLPPTTTTCTYIPACTLNNWSCTEWDPCSISGTQTRNCNKTTNCQGRVATPTTSQSCTYVPSCSVDTWKCGDWGTCSPQGVQTRSCSRTYDCPSTETAAPATSQYCEAPNQPKLQSPTEDLGIVNQESIIKSTVKLICPVSKTMASQGSGTVIDSKGTILTNKHVIEGTPGCLVGFIDNYDDEPYFGDRQIADIYKISSDADVAVLKLRNPSNKTLTSINIIQSKSSGIKLGEILTTYGYPAKFGTNITYTSGDFSGVDGYYLKTTAVIEHGNSGGGAYLKNGAFIGIPTAVVKGSLNSMGYLLSVDKVNSWLNNSVAYNNNTTTNNYSRVSALVDDIDINALGSLGLYITGDEENVKKGTGSEGQNVITEEKSLITNIDNILTKRLSGKILLQVEKNGEGWYVYPDNKKKYYLGRPADAFSIMRNLGLGIKHSELANYLNAKFPSRLSGKILLDVEKNGEAYYVNPNNLKGYFLNRPADAFKIMRELGLGITNTDIRKIDVGSL